MSSAKQDMPKPLPLHLFPYSFPVSPLKLFPLSYDQKCLNHLTLNPLLFPATPCGSKYMIFLNAPTAKNNMVSSPNDCFVLD